MMIKLSVLITFYLFFNVHGASFNGAKIGKTFQNYAKVNGARLSQASFDESKRFTNIGKNTHASVNGAFIGPVQSKEASFNSARLYKGRNLERKDEINRLAKKIFAGVRVRNNF